MEIEQVSEGSPVWLRLRVDTAALEAAMAARWFLIKRKDSLRTLPDGRRLLASELKLLRPAGTVEVIGRTWRSLSQGKVLLAFDYRDSLGTGGTLEAWLGKEAIDRVFVFQENAPSPARPDPKPDAVVHRNSGAGALFILIAPIAGGMLGLLYGKLKGDEGNSQPGMNAFVYSLTGMVMGLSVSIQLALLD